jgi:two-component system response regulator FixJ
MTDRRMVHVVDDDDSIRRAVGFTLRTSGYAVTLWDSGVAFLRAAKTAMPGCILLDVRMPGLDGLGVQQALAEAGIEMPVIVLTGHGDIGIAVGAMRAGAVDFLEKPFEKSQLLQALKTGFERLDRRDDARATASAAKVRVAALTPRERDVLHGLAIGYPNKTIAYDLGISPRTVEVHRANLMTKLHVHSLSDALRIAFAAGLDEEARKVT